MSSPLVHVVAITGVCEDGGEPAPVRATGLAWIPASGQKKPLVITLADLKDVGRLQISFPSSAGGPPSCLRAQALGCAVLQRTVDAFSSLASLGWSCRRLRFGSMRLAEFKAWVLRAEEALPDSHTCSEEFSAEAAWSDAPEESWVGRPVNIAMAPLGYATPAEPEALYIYMAATISNLSSPPGLVLLDARHCDASEHSAATGGGVFVDDPARGRRRCTACLAAPLRSFSAETVMYSVAVPLKFIAEAVLSSSVGSAALSPEERSALVPQGADPPLRPQPQFRLPRLVRNVLGHVVGGSSREGDASAQAYAALDDEQKKALRARRSVALVWLPSGSWASAVVVSKEGHLLTCAHFLMGRSWMESSENAAGGSSSSKAEPKKQGYELSSFLPKTCRAKAHIQLEDGSIRYVEMEARVLFVSEGYLDVALLKADVPRSAVPPGDVAFLPLPWHPAEAPREGSEVWVVGHGLFGPGTPWTGAAITAGCISRVARNTTCGRPAIIQSTAAVHRGSSGGALVDAKSCSLLGLVTTNVKHVDGSVMPKLNFSLPVLQLAPLRDEFLALPDDEREGALGRLADAWLRSEADPQEQALWRLEPEALWLPSEIEARKQQALQRVEQMIHDAERQDEADAEASGDDGYVPEEAVANAIVAPRASASVSPSSLGRRRWPSRRQPVRLRSAL
eukprot:TRINITY_DN58228_c0_g1_i1.p1 TRINITY_DN58228_c0_g1~~TRINITY_DN58228_c0_g1_i1.p1  ORF type:complete len:680 (-),score=125.88 TRINITY_DN58228_c0_g1_i1:12-2051(-)